MAVTRQRARRHLDRAGYGRRPRRTRAPGSGSVLPYRPRRTRASPRSASRSATRSSGRSGCPSRSSARPAVRRAAGVGRASRTTASWSTDPYLWTVVGRSLAFCVVNAALTLVDRHGHRPADDQDVARRAAARADRPAAGLGDAGAGHADRLAVALRHAVRHRQLGAHRLGGVVRGPLVAARAAVLLLRRHRDRGLDERAVRGVHRVRRAHPGPDDLVEAAELDGAGAVQRLRHVVLPAIRPILLVIGLLEVIWELGSSPRSATCSRRPAASPRAPTWPGTYIYRLGIGGGDFGTAAAGRDVHARPDRAC